MLISEALAHNINAQIGRELAAAHQYIAMACYFDSLALEMLSRKFFKQGEEEREHAQKFIKYLLDVGAEVRIPEVAAPKPAFASVEEAVKAALDYEMEVTRHINELMTQAMDEKDYAAQDFLRWFVTEQVEEVSSMSKLLQVAQMVPERQIIMVEAYLVHNT